MHLKLDKHQEIIEKYAITSQHELEQFKNEYLSKKGIINQLFDEYKTVPVQEKKELGIKLNNLKERANAKYIEFSKQFETSQLSNNYIDFEATAEEISWGSRHPVNLIRNRIIAIFSSLGFTVTEDREIEDDWHVFSGLNFAPDHPARDMQDTFFIQSKPEILLRTHTSSVQMRILHPDNLPIRTVMPGRVFRNEAISARSHCIFHQIEGLYVAKNVSFADLKKTLLYFAEEMFGKGTQIRLRPSYFPFTEPSAEMDITCSICKGKGCNICKFTGWLEIMGCGIVHPNVLKNTGIDAGIYSGYAFGMGIDRIAMLIYQIKDIRLLFENDIRFLKQFNILI